MSKILDFDDLEGLTDGDEGADFEHSSENPANYPPPYVKPATCDDCHAECMNRGHDMTTICDRHLSLDDILDSDVSLPLPQNLELPESVQENIRQEMENGKAKSLGQALIEGLEEAIEYERGEVELKATEVELPTALGIKLPSEIAIAVDALNCLGDIPLSIEGVAIMINVDPKSVYPVINTLRKAGIVASKKGPKGGTVLVKKDVSVGDLFSIFYKIESVPRDIDCQSPSQHLAQHLKCFYDMLKVKR